MKGTGRKGCSSWWPRVGALRLLLLLLLPLLLLLLLRRRQRALEREELRPLPGRLLGWGGREDGRE